MSREIIANEMGVKLVSQASGQYRLTTLRPNQPRQFADRADALAAFEVEVEASRRDPIVARLIAG